MKVFAQIFKVDEARQEVWGRATQEVVDKAGEIFDYESSKPYFKSWSDGFAADTDGKSLGNIRSMHGKVAAGKVISIDFNDAEKAIDIGTKIVDTNEWAKVLEGVHTGFSIGGSYAKKWADGENTRFTANPSEISLVDSPCVPTAKFFDVLKADGVTEQKGFRMRSPMGKVRKSMGEVCTFAQILQALCYIASDLAADAEWEGDATTVPQDLADWIAMGSSIFQTMAAEEVAELIAMIPAKQEAPMEMMAKAGARNSKSDLMKLQNIHDHATAMGACCGPTSEKSMNPEELEKMNSLTATVEKMAADNAALLERIAKLEAEPEPAKGFAKAVVPADDKTIDHAPTFAEMEAEAQKMEDPTERFKALLKLSYLQGPK